MKTTTFIISNLVCCGDQELLEKKLKINPHIIDASVNFVTQTATIIYHEGMINEEKIKKLISDCDFQCQPLPLLSSAEALRIGKHKIMKEEGGMEHDMSKMSHEDHEKSMSDPRMATFMEKDMQSRFLWSLMFSIPIFLYSPVFTDFLKITLPTPIPLNWLLFGLTTPVVFKFGSIFPIGAWRALKNKTLNMMVLIAVGVLSAYFFSVILMFAGGQETFFEAAALLTTFVLFGHWMEMKSRRGTSESLRALFDLVPPQARVMRNGTEVVIPTVEVKSGDLILLKPGDKVPVDGEVVEGETSIDESLITGESIPVSKKIGDKVVGGSINQTGSIKFKATKIGADTVLAQITKMVEIAQNSKAPGQRIADRAAQYLVILAVGVGLVTFIVWFFIFKQNLIFALTFAVSAVVIACPDALGLATPTAVAVGTGLAAKHNILIKDATTLEQVSKIKAVVLDKTGTLTEGKPKIIDVIAVPGFTEDEILRLDAAVEAKSGHPLSRAVINEVSLRKLQIPENIDKFNSISGHGVEAMVEGKHVLVGTIKLMQYRNVDTSPLQKDIDRLLDKGETLMILAVDGKIAGVAGAADTLKPTAIAAVNHMKKLGLEVVMLSGDNKKTADIIGKTIGIERVFAEVLPQDKAKYVKKLQDEGKFVAMVGDGVNDAPALAQSDIGIAIGAGTDVAIETANVVLMKSDPVDILRAIRLSRATVNKMKQNLVWASVYNILSIPIAAGILYPKFGITLRPEFSAILMSASSIIVALNAVLLKREEKNLVLFSS